MSRRRFATSALAATALIWAAGPAWAHVEISPGEAPAGATTELEFEVGHGCDGSPVVAVSIRMPAGVGDVAPGDRDGWTHSVETVDGLDVVTWEGGPQGADEHGHFHITVTLPDTEGEVLAFPAVQTCEEGEVAWIDLPAEDGSEPENPAPLLTLTAADASASPATTEAEADHAGEAAAEAAAEAEAQAAAEAAAEAAAAAADTTVPVTETTAAPPATVGTTEASDTTLVAATESDENSGGGAALYVGIAAGLALVGGGAFYLRKRSMNG